MQEKLGPEPGAPCGTWAADYCSHAREYSPKRMLEGSHSAALSFGNLIGNFLIHIDGHKKIPPENRLIIK